jgi:hypothetical protein
MEALFREWTGTMVVVVATIVLNIISDLLTPVVRTWYSGTSADRRNKRQQKLDAEKKRIARLARSEAEKQTFLLEAILNGIRGAVFCLASATWLITLHLDTSGLKYWFLLPATIITAWTFADVIREFFIVQRTRIAALKLEAEDLGLQAQKLKDATLGVQDSTAAMMIAAVEHIELTEELEDRVATLADTTTEVETLTANADAQLSDLEVLLATKGRRWTSEEKSTIQALIAQLRGQAARIQDVVDERNRAETEELLSLVKERSITLKKLVDITKVRAAEAMRLVETDGKDSTTSHPPAA